MVSKVILQRIVPAKQQIKIQIIFQNKRIDIIIKFQRININASHVENLGILLQIVLKKMGQVIYKKILKQIKKKKFVHNVGMKEDIQKIQHVI